MRPGGFAVSVNYRTSNGPLTERLDFNAFEDIRVVRRLLARRWSIALCVRDVLQTVPDYNTAVRVFSTVDLIAPCYIIVSGVCVQLSTTNID